MTTLKRSVRVLCEASRIQPAIFVRIDTTRGRKTEMAWYWIKPIPADYGQAFLVEKSATSTTEAATYHVNLNMPYSSCECKGYLAHGTKCKHIAAIDALIERGKLHPQTSEVHP